MASAGELVSKKNTKLAVWKHFGFKANDEGKPKDEDTAICRHCQKTVVAKGGNTSNLLTHLRNHHPMKHADVRKENEGNSKNDSSFKRSSSSREAVGQKTLLDVQKNDRKSKKWPELTDRVTYCIAKDMMPIYSVQTEGFRQLLYSFDPRYELPDRKYFSNIAIPKLYEKTRESVATDVKSAVYFASTTDLWSSQTMEPYLNYTVRYIGDDWRLQSRSLQTLYLPDDHTGENIAQALTVRTWELDSVKQVCVTSDNGRNIVCAVRSLSWNHLSCFGHNLHLAVQNSLKDDHRISRAFGVCRKLVSTFSHSWNKRRDLAKVQCELGLPIHSLVTDCTTRWGSTTKMIERVLEQEKAIRKVLCDDRKSTL